MRKHARPVRGKASLHRTGAQKITIFLIVHFFLYKLKFLKPFPLNMNKAFIYLFLFAKKKFHSFISHAYLLIFFNTVVTFPIISTYFFLSWSKGSNKITMQFFTETREAFELKCQLISIRFPLVSVFFPVALFFFFYFHVIHCSQLPP